MQEPDDDLLLGRLVRALRGVPGIRAVVLGGSRARGEATAQSDYDIGLYYEADNPIDIGRLAKAAMLLPGAASSSVTAIGEWGPWINGGAWLTDEGRRLWSKKRQVSRGPAVRPRPWTHKAIDSRPFRSLTPAGGRSHWRSCAIAGVRGAGNRSSARATFRDPRSDRSRKSSRPAPVRQVLS